MDTWEKIARKYCSLQGHDPEQWEMHVFYLKSFYHVFQAFHQEETIFDHQTRTKNLLLRDNLDIPSTKSENTGAVN